MITSRFMEEEYEHQVINFRQQVIDRAKEGENLGKKK